MMLLSLQAVSSTSAGIHAWKAARVISCLACSEFHVLSGHCFLADARGPWESPLRTQSAAALQTIPGGTTLLGAALSAPHTRGNFTCVQGLHISRWVRSFHDKKKVEDAEGVWSIPNLLSLSRVASAPVLGTFIVQEMWGPALSLMVLAGITDWLDGFLARRMGHKTALGSYLDPLGDKVLVASVVGALGYKGLLPLWLVVVVLSRDIVLVGSAAFYRYSMFEYKWPGRKVFFSVEGGSDNGGPLGVPGAPYMKPLMISKVNTVVQMALVTSIMMNEWQGWPSSQEVELLLSITLGCTVMSGAAYVYKYLNGTLR